VTVNQQIINFNENIDDSLGKPRYTVTIINVNALFTTASLRAKALRSVICNMQCNNIHYCQSTYHHYLPHFVRRRGPAVVVLVGIEWQSCVGTACVSCTNNTTLPPLVATATRSTNTSTFSCVGLTKRPVGPKMDVTINLTSSSSLPNEVRRRS
jgi:hypothetical protein